MRYAGQNHETEVPIDPESITGERLREVFAAFEAIHAERYGHAIAGEEIELVAFHVTVRGRRPPPPLVAHGREEGAPNRRPVFFRGPGTLETPVYRRYAVTPGETLRGPCILEEEGATTLIEPGMTVEVLPDRQRSIDTGVTGEGSTAR